MKRLKKVTLIILAVVILLGAVGAVLLSGVGKKLDALYDVRVEDVDLSAVPDGIYAGKYQVFPISVKVDVTVEGSRITAIGLTRHVNGQGGPAEAIAEKVIQAQSLQVDAISGATLSSKVILLAIDDALKNATGD